MDGNLEPAQIICRYCFEEGGQLISPCACAGSQKFVHFECLLRWQRSLLEEHPCMSASANYNDLLDVCNVCKNQYSRESPKRLDLVQSFTGLELPKMIDIGCLIAPNPRFMTAPELLEPLLERDECFRFPDSAFLIVDVGETFVETVEFEEQERLMTFMEQVSPIWIPN
eukprot:gnl/MRDRNA2_/MRDRNA2_20273_c0_seq1.p1 gnl/MRDRNA2_/MRDRNA2_20273_c0~~gnl/MRDRNA2_/MRDRNA2_20273_c0_seq1.p1  ORF type:complete len:169 (+),score=21.01 gnl/MRDRNA2_/MRDRNA2_20273_c0_seq1:87-593(+)